MPLGDDLRTLRARVQADRDRRPLPPEGSAPGVLIGQVYNAGAMPTAVPGQFAVHPVTIGGTEAEGRAVTITPDTASKAVFTVLGPAVPQVGDVLIARQIGGRWEAMRGQGKPPLRLHGQARGCTYYQGNPAHTNGTLTFDVLNNIPFTVYRATASNGTGTTSDPVALTGTTDAAGNFDVRLAWNNGYLVRFWGDRLYGPQDRQTGLISGTNFPTDFDLTFTAVPPFSVTAGVVDAGSAVCVQTCAGGPVPGRLFISDGSGTYPFNYGFLPGAPFPPQFGSGLWGYRRDIAALGYPYNLATNDCPGPAVMMTIPVLITLRLGVVGGFGAVPGANLFFTTPVCAPVAPGLATATGPLGPGPTLTLYQNQFTCHPFSATFTLNSAGTVLANVFPGTTTFTISE